MSDTIQCVRWTIEWLAPRLFCAGRGGEVRDSVLWASIARIGLEAEFRHEFQIIAPLWYGLWIDSPLNQMQCALLFSLLSDLSREQAIVSDEWHDFLNALEKAAESNYTLRVELTPPWHVDFGWVTTFVHCPRCKAEGPFQRWQSEYTTEPIACPVCGTEYVPASTYKAEREYFTDYIPCSQCDAWLAIKDLPADQIKVLENEHYYLEALEEQEWLQRVERFYGRHPEWRDKIRIRLGNYREAVAPSREVIHGPGWSYEDRDVVEYLRHHFFNLERRKEAIDEAIRSREPLFRSGIARCPHCGGGIAADARIEL